MKIYKYKKQGLQRIILSIVGIICHRPIFRY